MPLFSVTYVSNRVLTSTWNPSPASASGKSSVGVEQLNYSLRCSARRSIWRSLEFVIEPSDILSVALTPGLRKPISPVSQQRLQLFPMAADSSTSLSFPGHHCSQSFLRFQWSWRLGNLGFLLYVVSRGRTCEHPIEHLKSSIYFVPGVYVSTSPAWQLPLCSGLLWFVSGGLSAINHFLLTTTSLKTLAEI